MTTHVEAAIERYFEGRIDDITERDALFGHLDRCDGCRRRFDELAGVQRALAGGTEIPATELALIGRTVVAGAAARKTSAQPWFVVARVLAPMVALGIAAVVLLQPPPELTSKGGGEAGSVGIEALCFDPSGAQTKVLKESGECPAPGLVKLVYASARSVDRLTVRAGSWSAELVAPAPRSTIPGHVALEVGQRLEVVAVAGDSRSAFTITGVKP
jgi:hypothetical protein